MRALRIIITTLLLLLPALSAGAGVIVEPAPDPGLASAVEAAARRWETALTSRSNCLGTVTVGFEDLPSRRGEYRTREAKVVIDSEVAIGEAPLVAGHELAHHAFVACGGYADPSLKLAFYAAQGLPPDREWFDYSAGWDQAPAELFAEAMTELHEGTTAHGTHITPAAIDVVARWRDGRPLTVSTPTTTTTTSTTTTTQPAASGSGSVASTATATAPVAPENAPSSGTAERAQPGTVGSPVATGSTLGSRLTVNHLEPASVRLAGHLLSEQGAYRPPPPPRID